jgi:hypothetical protein
MIVCKTALQIAFCYILIVVHIIKCDKLSFNTVSSFSLALEKVKELSAMKEAALS